LDPIRANLHPDRVRLCRTLDTKFRESPFYELGCISAGGTPVGGFVRGR
jgi:hypothetical protein